MVVKKDSKDFFEEGCYYYNCPTVFLLCLLNVHYFLQNDDADHDGAQLEKYIAVQMYISS